MATPFKKSRRGIARPIPSARYSFELFISSLPFSEIPQVADHSRPCEAESTSQPEFYGTEFTEAHISVNRIRQELLILWACAGRGRLWAWFTGQRRTMDRRDE